jgi:hypothetical protein
LARFFDDTFTFSEARSGGHILVYYIPGASADSTRGKRRLNWVWYVGADDAVGGTENFTILATVRGSIPNCRAASRWLSPSIWTA